MGTINEKLRVNLQVLNIYLCSKLDVKLSRSNSGLIGGLLHHIASSELVQINIRELSPHETVDTRLLLLLLLVATHTYL